MHPDQSGGPAPGNNYDFILNPQQQAAKPSVLGGGSDRRSFLIRLGVVIGGAVVLMIAVAMVTNLVFSSKTNLDDLVALTQSEQELVRLSEQGGRLAVDQTVKNAASNTRLSLKTHQQKWLLFLSRHGRGVGPAELALKKSTATDKQLATAKQTSTFDTVLTNVMREQLMAYASNLKSAHTHATNKQERVLLSEQYDETKLLLTQWPAASN